MICDSPPRWKAMTKSHCWVAVHVQQGVLRVTGSHASLPKKDAGVKGLPKYQQGVQDSQKKQVYCISLFLLNNFVETHLEVVLLRFHNVSRFQNFFSMALCQHKPTNLRFSTLAHLGEAPILRVNCPVGLVMLMGLRSVCLDMTFSIKKTWKLDSAKGRNI